MPSFKILEHLADVGVNYQPLTHMAIAANRFTALTFPFRHSAMWKSRIVVAIIAGLFIVAIMLVAIPSVYYATTQPVDSEEGDLDQFREINEVGSKQTLPTVVAVRYLPTNTEVQKSLGFLKVKVVVRCPVNSSQPYALQARSTPSRTS